LTVLELSPATYPLNDLAAIVAAVVPSYGLPPSTLTVGISVTGVTTWLSGWLVLAVLVESPTYIAVTEYVPAGRVELVKVAEPALVVFVENAVPFVANTMDSPSGGAGLTVAVMLNGLP
jgi:hypothetical protein